MGWKKWFDSRQGMEVPPQIERRTKSKSHNNINSAPSDAMQIQTVELPANLIGQPQDEEEKGSFPPFFPLSHFFRSFRGVG